MEKFVKLHTYSVGVLTVKVLSNALPKKAFCHVGRQKDVELDSLNGTHLFYEQKNQRFDNPILVRGKVNSITIYKIMAIAFLCSA